MKNATEVLILDSRLSSINEIHEFADFLHRKYQLNSISYGNILTCLLEAVNNAIIHGNQNDMSKNVKVTYRMERHKRIMTINVKDQGKGFNPNKIPDPTAKEFIEECGGRGLLFIKNLSDKVLFGDNGTQIKMTFKL